MPKSIALGNGNVFVGLDKYAQVNDFYFPYVGLENQVGGHHVHKIGVWVDGKFSWIDDGTWEVKINYTFESLVSQIEAFNHDLNIKIEFKDAVYNELDIFLRQVTIYNLGDQAKQIKIFFHQKFEIYESVRGDTAYFEPLQHVIIHYKGRRVFLVNLASDNENFSEYSVGNFNIEGKEGTFKDAEDGILSKNPVEHGLVDSVVGFTCQLQSLESKTLYYWIAAARSIDEAKKLNRYLLTKSPQHLIKTTENFWRAWVNKEAFNFGSLSPEIISLFKKSLLITRTQVDNRGAIIASCDSDMLQHGKDNYSYMWPRDGALVAIALDEAGDNNIAKRFFEFCNNVITTDGYFMHKYRSDQSLGSSWHPWIKNGQIELPIQEDETALVIIALRQHFELTKDLEFIEGIYNSLIKKATEFMISFRDPETKLPKPSYDLWEEKFGIHTFTVASVYGALIAGSQFADLLGKTDEANRSRTAAAEIKEALLKYLYDPELNYFYKMVNFTDQGIEIDRIADISSMYGVFKYGVLDPTDEKLVKAFQYCQEKLTVKTAIGGIVRYEGDDYYRVSPNTPGNPWIISSLWLGQYLTAQAKSAAELKPAEDWLSWVVKQTISSGIMPEQFNPEDGSYISAAPLTWSHAEFITSVLAYLRKLKNLPQ